VSSSRTDPDAPRRTAPAAAAQAWGEQAAALTQVIRGVVAAELRLRATDPLVDDLTQEVLRRALEGRARLRAQAPLRPWVIGIARHVAADERRRRGRAPADTTGNGGTGGALAGEADPGAGADDLIHRARRLHGLRAALARVPEPWRRALLLFHLEDLSYQQIARELGVPVGTVGTWISRGRDRLVTALQEEEQP
jgi:RNA polymerase sigma factor (sigma-70 family)